MKKALLILILITSCKGKTDTFEPQSTSTLSPSETYFLTLVNHYRESKGLNPLLSEKSNQHFSQVRTKELQDQGKLTHNTFPAIKQKMIDSGLKNASENIAWRYKDVKEAFRAFTNSEGHNKNLLHPSWKYTGISITDDNYYCQIFSK